MVKDMISRAPVLPGVYIMKDALGNVLYVGKAIRLRDRLLSYSGGHDDRPSVKIFVPKIQDIEWVVTHNEKEALLLENSLIKTHKPKYNIDLRDDKSYVSLRLSHHRFPRLFITRKIVQDGSQYYGPYSSAGAVRETIRLAQKLFKVRDCKDSFFNNRTRPCLRYQIKRCSAPCVQLVSPEAYQAQTREVDLFLRGKTDELVENMKVEMAQASGDLRFEEAGRLRDRIWAMEKTLEPQKVESREDDRDADAIAMSGDEQATLVQVLKVRNGRMIGSDQMLIAEPISAKIEILRTFLHHRYLREDGFDLLVPSQVLIPLQLEDEGAFSDLLTDRVRKKIQVFQPMRGFARKLLDLSQKNADVSLLERKRKSTQSKILLSDVQKTLALRHLPERIEGYDISNISGTNPVGSMVVFSLGEPDKKQYRHFSIKGIKGPNDFAMMKEMLLRRFSKTDRYQTPSLVLIDGGKGQLKQAMDVFTELNIHGIDLISIAKEKDQISRHGKKLAPERFFKPNQKNALVLPSNSPVLHLLMRVRDEAHRFGITHHRKKRKKTTLQSSLSTIPGVGAKRLKILLSELGSLERVRNSSLNELQSIQGIDLKTASSIYHYFHTLPDSSEE